MEKRVLVFIVSPLMGHLTQSLEMAKLMLERNHQLSITFPIMKLPIDPDGTSKIQSFITACTDDRVHFHHLPEPEDTSSWNATNRLIFLNQIIEYHKPHVKELVSTIKGNLCGFIIDSVTTSMIDVADELGLPSYIFFTSGAAFLGLMLHFQSLQDEQNRGVCELIEGNNEISGPSFSNRIPISVIPSFPRNKEIWSNSILHYIRGYRRATGIIVNTFFELESVALNSFLVDVNYGKSRLPPTYPVGPIINRFQTCDTKNHSEMMDWLDAQPANSVVLLCFGSMGSFDLDQVKEIAYGLEQSGYRFLWSLRQPPAPKGGFPSEYENYEQVLPEGFLDRTTSIGKIVGWIPQFDVLSHSAVGGFVSHCGWNSILESIWYGVPIATWPLFAEQQLNAFQLVKELGVAVEISLDYDDTNEDQAMVKAKQVEKGIRELMDGENEVRKKVKELSEKSKLAVKEGGSSHIWFENVIQTICSKATFVSEI